MKKLLLLCLISSGAVYAMNESAATSSTADSKKEAAAPAVSSASMSEADFRREMLAIEREKLAVEKERLVTEKIAACISILKLTEADIGIDNGTGTIYPRCTKCGTGLSAVMTEQYTTKQFRACDVCNTRHYEPTCHEGSRLEQIKRIAVVSFLAQHPNEEAHAAAVAVIKKANAKAKK